MGDAEEELSAYELERRENIRKNNERLVELGLDAPMPAPRRMARPSARPLKTKLTRPVVEPVRRSTRQRAAVSPYTDETPFPSHIQPRQLLTRPRPYEAPDDEEDEAMAADATSASAVPQSVPVERAAAAAGSARTIALDIDSIMERHLGKPMADTFTKAAAIEAMTGKHSVSFSKYSGSLEWRNAIVLWVNIGGADYRNVFLDGGGRMTWYASPRNHEGTPVVQRLLSGRSSVVLLCRLPGEPYVCCGRLEYLSHVPGRQPLKFEWRLADLPALRQSADFRALLAAAD